MLNVEVVYDVLGHLYILEYVIKILNVDSNTIVKSRLLDRTKFGNIDTVH